MEGMGRPANEERVWRIRREREHYPGSENVYYATKESAFAAAQKAKKEGRLIFFAEYRLEKVIRL